MKRFLTNHTRTLMLCKYIFALCFPVLCVRIRNASPVYILTAVTEVLLIAVLTNLLSRIRPSFGYILNTAALLVMNVQFAVHYWGNTFVSIAMLENLDSLQALDGKVLEYGMTAVLVAVCTLLPVQHIPVKRRTSFLSMALCITLYIGVSLSGMAQYTPFYALGSLCQQQIRRIQTARLVSSSSDDEAEFFQAQVADYIQKPDDLPASPNVILIFIEGLSQNILEDERNVMPNLTDLQERSISFENYYNHTFATYMGLSGQLYSGYQQNVYDSNSLVSIQDVFKTYGYQTSFINTEPNNIEFTDYLNNFGFDFLLTDESRTDGAAAGLSDKSAYELLWETALEQSSRNLPFFLSMYSFGTHVSQDSIHEKFSDGSSPLLNRFYDLDVQIGTFLEKFEESSLSENTVLIVTTDHATYWDSDFISAYPEYTRDNEMLDRIPLCIYYPGIEPASYDAEGRNSLDMTPTVLDFLDMSDTNFFLGESLFSPTDNNSPYDTLFESMGIYSSTKNGQIQTLTAEELRYYEPLIIKYFSAKQSDGSVLQSYEDAVHIYANVNEDRTAIHTELLNAEDWDVLLYAVWSEEGGQDDLTWYSVDNTDGNLLSYTINLSDFDTGGVYCIHVYGAAEDSQLLLAYTDVNID